MFLLKLDATIVPTCFYCSLYFDNAGWWWDHQCCLYDLLGHSMLQNRCTANVAYNGRVNGFRLFCGQFWK